MLEKKTRIWTMDVEKNTQSMVEFSKLLNKNNIRGEFYVCGHIIEEFPDLCKKISKKHMIGGHGYYHENFGKLTKSKQEKIIIQTKKVFEKNNIKLETWRFPGFRYTNLSFHLLVKQNILIDSSLKDSWFKWPTVIIWFKTIKYEHKLTFPYIFPKKLKELPWSVLDLSGKGFLDQGGRIVIHCYNYPKIKNKIEKLIWNK